MTLVDAPQRALPGQVDPDPGLAIGRALPNVPWTIRQRDRIYNMLIAGGQGSGKSSKLLRVALSDVFAPNTATVVLDMKGSLSERLLRLTPPDLPKRWWDAESESWQEGFKRVWYLDLGRPAFGLTPLHVEPGWSHTGLADEFARIADAVTRALLDLYPGQIMGSSEDLIERAVVGTMSIAWWEHERRCERERRDPTRHGFSGSFEVLSQMFAPTDRYDHEDAQPSERGRRRSQPNRWHQAAGRACQKLPNLDQVADTLLYEIPRQARDNLGDIAKRMEAPANKIRPLVGAAASVRRFVGHPERLSLRSVIEAHDVLVVNPRIELIGEDQASILTNFIVHMLDLQMKRQVAVERSHRPRVSLIIDEAHRLVTDTLVTMAATHREAGLTVAAAVQYVSQLGADAPSAARRDKIVKGVGNLFQSKLLFRMSDSEDADQHTQIFRSVYETMVRADPTSRARMPFDPSRMQTLRDHHALVSLVCTADGGAGSAYGDASATRLPAFVSQSFRMPEIEEIADGWRDEHLDRQRQVFTRYPEDMTTLANHDVPEGLAGTQGGGARTAPRPPSDAGEVARDTVGRMPDVAMRKKPTAAFERAVAEEEAAAGRPRAEAAEARHDDRLFDARDKKPRATSAPGPGYDDELFGKDRRKRREPAREQPTQAEPAEIPEERAAPGWESVGGVRIERSEEPASAPPLPRSMVLEVACRPTGQPLPHHDLGPATEPAQEALREVATYEAIASLGAWTVAGDEVRRDAQRAARKAQEQAVAEGEAAGLEQQEVRRTAERRARRAAAAALAREPDSAWRIPIGEMDLGDGDAHTLEVIARVRFAAPRMLGVLLEERPSERVLRERLARLHDAGLIARSDVSIDGRRGRRPRLYTPAPRGLEYLRARHAELRPDGETPAYLRPDRELPSVEKGGGVPHELAIQLVLASLRQYGGPATQLHWHTTRMPGGRWDVGMIHGDRRDRELRTADLLPAPGLTAHGERLDAHPVLEPDLSLELRGPVGQANGAIDLLIEVGGRGGGQREADRFAAWDQFLGGWCLRTRRWGYERRGRPLAVFVALGPKPMFELMRAADDAMALGFAGGGHYDATEFDYPGRTHVAFTCLEWLLGGQALALRLPEQPPSVRASAELRPERVALLPEEWWPEQRAGR